MTRRCSHCNNNGHNSRTCPTRAGGSTTACGSGGGGVVKLFGVRLTDGSIMKKSASMGNLSSLHYHSSSSAAASPNSNHHGSPEPHLHLPDGYLSDDPTTHASSSSSANRRLDRKKGVPWTEEEHRLFLLGLQKLGKGDWRGISRNYVTSRTPTQVASHAQKYFIRQSNATRRKRRSSLFDIVADSGTDAPHPPPEEQFMLPPRAIESDKEQTETEFADSLPSLNLSLKPDFESMEATPSEHVEETNPNDIPAVFPAFFPAYIPVPYPFWPSNTVAIYEDNGAEASHHQIVKPIPSIPKEPVNVDALVGMSQLTLAESGHNHIEPSALSLKLTTEPSRQSAFHASTPVKNNTKGETAPIQAV